MLRTTEGQFLWSRWGPAFLIPPVPSIPVGSFWVLCEKPLLSYISQTLPCLLLQKWQPNLTIMRLKEESLFLISHLAMCFYFSVSWENKLTLRIKVGEGEERKYTDTDNTQVNVWATVIQGYMFPFHGWVTPVVFLMHFLSLLLTGQNDSKLMNHIFSPLFFILRASNILYSWQ